MPDIKIAIIYCSATNVTKTYAEIIQEELSKKGCDVDLFDVTSFSSRQKKLRLNSYNGFVFGFPVFSDFAPTVINEWIPKLVSNCILKNNILKGDFFIPYISLFVTEKHDIEKTSLPI